jgi:hypothetical protein
MWVLWTSGLQECFCWVGRAEGSTFFWGAIRDEAGHPLGSRLLGEPLRAALHLEAGPIPLEADCMKI